MEESIIETILETARLQGVPGITSLIRKGAHLDARDENGLSALDLAAKAGHFDAIRALIEAGADPAAADPDGGTALHLACVEGNESCARELLAGGAKVSARKSDGWEPLHSAAANGNKGIVSLLLAAGANPAARTGDGETAYALAKKMGENQKGKSRPAQEIAYAEIAEALERAERSQKIQEDERKPSKTQKSSQEWLFLVAAGENVRELDELLSNGARINEKNPEGLTALMLATKVGNSDFARALIAAGANLHEQDRHGWTALHHAGASGYPILAGELIRAGANPVAKGYQGETPTEVAMEHGNDRTAMVLKKFEPSREELLEKLLQEQREEARNQRKAMDELLETNRLLLKTLQEQGQMLSIALGLDSSKKAAESSGNEEAADAPRSRSPKARR